MNTVKVFLADYHEWFRRSLADYVESQIGFKVVGETGDAAEVLRKVEDLQPDLVFLDLDIPACDGFETTRAIKSISPRTKVVILSLYPERQYREAARQNDADEFIDKGTMKTVLSSFLSSIHSDEERVAS